MPYKDPKIRRERERERHRRRTAERKEMGLCPKCGRRNPAPGRSLCEDCLDRGRKSEQARYIRRKAAGDPYGLCRARHNPYNAEWLLMPSEVPEVAISRGFPANSLGIKFDAHPPPSTSISSSLTPEKTPGRIDGGALTSRIFSFSFGVARRYISVVLTSA